MATEVLRPSIGALELVAAALRRVLPRDYDIHTGGFREGNPPDRACALMPFGGRGVVRRPGTRTPKFAIQRVRVGLRDANRDNAYDWIRRMAERIHHHLDAVSSIDPITLDETIYFSPGVYLEGVRSTFGKGIFFTVTAAPAFRDVSEDTAKERRARRVFTARMDVEVKWQPRRDRPLSVPLGPWSSARYPVLLPTQTPVVYTARTTAVPPAGGRGRVFVGGEVEVGDAVSRLLPGDPRNPRITPEEGGEGNPLPARDDGLLWVNVGIPTEDRSGVLDIWTRSTSGNEIRTGVRITRADVLDTDQLRVRVSRHLVDADLPDGVTTDDLAFLVQDQASPPNRYILRLADATEATFSGDDVYLFPFTPDPKVETTDTWDWALVDLTKFRLDPVQSDPVENPTWRLRWRVRWEGASQFLGEQVAVFNGAGNRRPARDHGGAAGGREPGADRDGGARVADHPARAGIRLPRRRRAGLRRLRRRGTRPRRAAGRRPRLHRALHDGIPRVMWHTSCVEGVR